MLNDRGSLRLQSFRTVKCVGNFLIILSSRISHFTVGFCEPSKEYCLLWQSKLWASPFKISPYGISFPFHMYAKHLFIVLFENIIHHFWHHIFYICVRVCDVRMDGYNEIMLSSLKPKSSPLIHPLIHSFIHRLLVLFLRTHTHTFPTISIQSQLPPSTIPHLIIGFIVSVRSKIKL